MRCSSLSVNWGVHVHQVFVARHQDGRVGAVVVAVSLFRFDAFIFLCLDCVFIFAV
jgi:hypothetical protein